MRSSYPFVYQRPSRRLDALRGLHKLKEVAGEDKKTEFEQLVALRTWTRHQWHNGWSSNDLCYCAPCDALVILDMAPRGKAMAFCGHYATVFIQCAQSLGYNARLVTGRAHAYSEAWSNEFRKWVLMDVGPTFDDEAELNYHYVAQGVPLSTLDVHRRWLTKDWSGMEVVPGKPGTEHPYKKDPEWMGVYEYIAMPFRNNLLDSPLPGDLDSNGDVSDTEWLVWRDGAQQTLHPEFPYTTDRPGDLYWTLNQVAIYPCYGKQAGMLHLDFDTQTPNFKRYEVRLDGGAWRSSGSSIDWPLHAGRNLLEARIVNAFEKPGIVSTMEVNYLK